MGCGSSKAEQAQKKPVAAAQAAPPQAAPQPTYRDRFVAVDSTTGGDWRSRYGAEGHLLFSYTQSMADVQQLAPTITGVATNCPYTGVKGKASAPNWANCSTDRRALVPPTALLEQLNPHGSRTYVPPQHAHNELQT